MCSVMLWHFRLTGRFFIIVVFQFVVFTEIPDFVNLSLILGLDLDELFQISMLSRIGSLVLYRKV